MNTDSPPPVYLAATSSLPTFSTPSNIMTVVLSTGSPSLSVRSPFIIGTRGSGINFHSYHVNLSY